MIGAQISGGSAASRGTDMRPILFAAAGLLFAAPAADAAAQTVQTYRYDANGRVIAAINADYGGGGNWTRYLMDNANNRTNRLRSQFAPPLVRSELRADEQIVPSQALYSPDFSHELIVMPDGNVVLRTSSAVLWCTGTANGQAMTFYMSGGGQVSLYGPDLNPVWQSGSSGSAASRLVVGNDGSLRIYDGATVVWSATGGCP